jgi:hypothetical protein
MFSLELTELLNEFGLGKRRGSELSTLVDVVSIEQSEIQNPNSKMGEAFAFLVRSRYARRRLTRSRQEKSAA